MADGGTAGYLEDFRARGEGIAAACTRCGACFKACPMVAPAGLAEAEPEETAGGIIDLITGGAGTAAAVGWASVCSGSGNCIPACPEGINTRFMVQLARGFARAQAGCWFRSCDIGNVMATVMRHNNNHEIGKCDNGGRPAPQAPGRKPTIVSCWRHGVK